ncbi:MAG: ABC transporter substrate-binding protein [Thermodesulfobacteriota bacterium]
MKNVTTVQQCLPAGTGALAQRTVFFLGLLIWLVSGNRPCLAGDAPGGGNVIRIASIFARSGPAAQAHIPSALGVRWAVDELNSNGGIQGLPVTLLELDNQSTPIGSKIAADEAVAAGVSAVIGPAWSSHSMAAARVLQAGGIPMISNISTNPEVTRIGDCIFRVCCTDIFQGRILAEFASREIEVKRVAILRDLSSDYSIGLTRTFQTEFTRMGGLVPAVIDYRGRQQSFRELMDAIKMARPDAVFLPGYDDSGPIVAEMARSRLSVVVIGGDGWDIKSFFLKGGNRLAHGYYATHWNEAVDSVPSKSFYNRYKERTPFLAPAALSYDAVYLLADAIRRAGSTSRPAIRESLAATCGFEGVTGTLCFNRKRDPVKSMVIMKIIAGQPHYHKQVTPSLEREEAEKMARQANAGTRK